MSVNQLAPDKFDAWGAGLDAVGILGDLSGTPTGAAAAGVSDVVSVYRSAWALAQAARGGAPSSEVRSAVVDFAVDIASFRWNYWPDMLSLYLNFRSATYTDVVR